MESVSPQNVNDLESKPKGWMTRVWSWYMSQNGNWLEKQRGILILATTMVALVSFYSALHPPGGTFTDSRNGPLGNAVQTEVVIGPLWVTSWRMGLLHAITHPRSAKTILLVSLLTGVGEGVLEAEIIEYSDLIVNPS
ncbi:ankyrin repeat-containing domain, PGG domain protein [Artemisia annua]|uniref:Ankyrin repeat-containing domain, PGG domain protein n=1 Tax=Artemisia annua TaxID=35608 RepID=A0A2U1MPH7_ARTAN|nr:ankyrin repeat-containing domain, PGG domain protein [Artemisia annua]